MGIRLVMISGLAVVSMALLMSQPPAFSQPMGRGPGASRMMSEEEFNYMKSRVKNEPTNAYNFEERIKFAQDWAFRLLRSNPDAVGAAIPPSTFRNLRAMHDTAPMKAYAELDKVFIDLERLDLNYRDRPRGPGRGGMGMGRKQGAPSMMDPNVVRPSETALSGEAIAETLDLKNPVTGVKLWAKTYHPKDSSKKYPAVVFIPGGLGYGSQRGNEKMASDIAAAGFVVAVFDPDGRGASGGTEDYNGPLHQEGLKELIKSVSSHPLAVKENIGVVSQSYGLALAAGALARLSEPAMVKYLVDFEGPSDRRQITVNDAAHIVQLFGGHTSADIAFWAEREPLNFMSRIKARYLRIQAEKGHMTKPGAEYDRIHPGAIALVNAATSKQHGGGGESPWTRVNGPENAPNQTYSETKVPKYRTETGPISVEEMTRFIREMADQS